MHDDLISREAVRNIVNDIRDCISVEGYWAICERLKKLPPVNPTKTEYWISHHHGCEYECSECHDKQKAKSKYCPNCGERMIEPQERSEE